MDSIDTQFNIIEAYQRTLDSDSDVTMPLAAIEALVELLSISKASTISEYMAILQRGGEELKYNVRNSYSLSAGVDVFLRYVSRSIVDPENFEQCKSHLINNGKLFIERAKKARYKIADIASRFIHEDSVILLHGYSRTVFAVLQQAAKKCNNRFRVIIGESRPSASGIQMAHKLNNEGISCSIISDTAIGYFMKKVSIVLIGAEGVVENGGLINQMGTYQIAALAKLCNVPFYAVVEAHKFVRIYPLDQFDLLPDHNPNLMISPSTPNSSVLKEKLSLFPDQRKELDLVLQASPAHDYTPAEFITALITDIGILDPTNGVSEELIRMYL